MTRLHCFVSDSIAMPGSERGPLSGRNFVAKDLFALRGRVSSFGSARWRETHAPARETADVVAALLGAGARLAGLTVMDQLAYSLIGNVGEGEPPVNPRHPDRFTGGSSSGTASAVAGKLADLGVGTDTAGSIRVPAAACGIRSLRPTHGVLSVRGVVPLAPSFDVVGLCSRSAGVLLEAFGVLAPPPASGAPEIDELLLARDVLREVEEGEAIERAASELARRSGLKLQDVELSSFTGEESAALFARLQGTEIWERHGAWVSANREVLDDDVCRRLDRCRAAAERPAAERTEDGAARVRYAESLSRLLGEKRAIVLPVVPRRIPLRTAPVEDLRDFRARTFRLTAPASLSGCPQAVVPCGDVALGLLGPRGSDPSLLRLT